MRYQAYGFRALSFALFLLLTTLVAAQNPGGTATIEYQGGQRISWTDDGAIPPGELLAGFLQNAQDGRMTVMQDGRIEFILDKVGEQITISGPSGPPETMTIQEFIEGLQADTEPEPQGGPPAGR